MDVAVFRSVATGYPEKPPYHPPAPYPEIEGVGIRDTGQRTPVYAAVRETLLMLGLDRAHFGTPNWNPLGRYVRPGDKVVIKPNLVLHEYGPQKGANCLTTHGSIIRAVVDYACLATGPDGKVVIADAPLQGADFKSIAQGTGLHEIQEYYWRTLRREIEVLDLRQVGAVIDETSSFIKRTEHLKGDPLGYQVIDLGRDSRLQELDASAPRYVVGDYGMAMTNTRHKADRHEYVVSRTMLSADAIISVPKLKTHSKAGITVCLKNLVGIIGSKDCLPHHRLGKLGHGGDEFPVQYPWHWVFSNRVSSTIQGRVPQALWRVLRGCASVLLGAGTPGNGHAPRMRSRFFPSGGWHGNDTIWRTVDDLNRILFFYDEEHARLAEQQQRRFFAIVDGIVAMEGNGPLKGSPRACGLVLAGEDALCIDLVAATLMGFDWRRIRMLSGICHSPHEPKYSGFLGDEAAIQILSNDERWRSLKGLNGANLAFQAPVGWQNHVEMQGCGPSRSTIASL